MGVFGFSQYPVFLLLVLAERFSFAGVVSAEEVQKLISVTAISDVLVNSDIFR
jgi:hypothetical protein